MPNFKFLAPSVSQKSQFQNIFRFYSTLPEDRATNIMYSLCWSRDSHNQDSIITFEISSVIPKITPINRQTLFLYNICIN